MAKTLKRTIMAIAGESPFFWAIFIQELTNGQEEASDLPVGTKLLERQLQESASPRVIGVIG